MKTIEINFNGKILRVLENTALFMFKTDVNEDDFRKWAHKNPEKEISEIYHPYTQDEMIKMKECEKWHDL